MKPNPSLAFLLFSLLMPLSACNSVGVGQSSTPADPASEDASAEDQASAELDLSNAALRMEIAELELTSFEAMQADRRANANVELSLAKKRLMQFNAFTEPTRIQQEELDLKSVKESAAEAAEELQQIELMYKDQDLNDMTREFVVARGQRRAENAKARIEIREANMTAVLSHELPMQREQLSLGVARAEQALRNLASEKAIGTRNKQLSIAGARHKLEQAEKALAKLQSGDSE